MILAKRRAFFIGITMVLTFIIMRIYLHTFPGTNFDVAGYNIHHLFTGIVILLFTGLPLVLFHNNNHIFDALCIGFGVGLSMILDEWVYLITTDGSDQSYLLPISLWGGVVMISIAILYLLALLLKK
jgi:hypothetical protein